MENSQLITPEPIQNKSFHLVCPSCRKKDGALLSRSELGISNLNVECLLCKEKTKVNLDDYLKLLNGNENDKYMCQKKGGAHKNIEAIKYCNSCKSFYCQECSNFHDEYLEGHELVAIDQVHLGQCKCESHNKLFKNYCYSCKISLCESCNLNEHKSLNHKIYDLTDLYKNADITKKMNNLEQFENYVSKELLENKNQIISHLKKMIEKLEKDYITLQKYNSLVKMILKNSSENNYVNIQNAINLSNSYNFDKFNDTFDFNKDDDRMFFNYYFTFKKYLNFHYSSNVCFLNYDKVLNTKNFKSNINIANEKTHDGGAIFDDQRRIMVSTSGEYNNGQNLKVTTINDNLENITGKTILYENVIPFKTHGSYPIYDGEKYIYFFESESGNNNRFGKINIDEIPKNFIELPSIPDKFIEYSSSVFHFGKIYSINSKKEIWTFDINVSIIIFYND